MLKVKSRDNNGTKTIVLDGSIVDTIDFAKLVGPVPSRFHVNCRRIDRFNSEGIRSWIRFFSDLKSRGIEFVFEECPPSMVEQMNFILNFRCGGTVESFYAPFRCTKCGANYFTLLKPETVRKTGFSFDHLSCAKCKGKIELDDVEEEYFSFLDPVK